MTEDLAVLALLFVGFFEWGRSSMRREIRKYYADYVCRECGEPAVRVERIHDPWSSSKHD